MKKLFGLIGFPLTQAFSPTYFNTKFKVEKIENTSYEAFPLPNLENLKELLANHPYLVGLNVTIPYKKAVIQYLDELSSEAQQMGAVNTISVSRQNNKTNLKGYNTDVIGFEASIKPLLRSCHQAALILGTGGAAMAAAWVFGKLGIEYIFVSRKPEGPKEILYDDLTEPIIEKYTVIVNATPVGMFPHSDNCPALPYQYLSSHHLLFDMIYNPAETLFLQHGKIHGASIQNGLEMLHFQAEAAWKIWQENSSH